MKLLHCVNTVETITHRIYYMQGECFSLSYMLNRRVSEVVLPPEIKYLGIESTSWPRFQPVNVLPTIDDDETLLMTYLICSGPGDDVRAELPYDMDEINHKAGVNLPVNRVGNS
ncbi:hypothetical protein Glove_372g110 [Diversispora epigaea]|uniref:Uncharacterized protein n=1 Tax=Diversispora epigaea TaxID=1348612 RepID=A0A397HB59_9GLOM|nr:hypothetical protein Glove_372g110 [Diversispora epigaea]